MTAFETILCPTDFSDRAQVALPVARNLARDQGARLVLLFVEPIEVLHAGGIPVPMDPRVFHEAMADLRKDVEGPDLKFPVETRLERGDASAAICRVAAELPASLIVMGTHGRSGLGRLILGSVAESVARHAPCPVLTVKAPVNVPAAKVQLPMVELV